MNPFKETAKPVGFSKQFKYTPDNSMPCDEYVSKKTNAVTQLNTVFDELKVRPVEENESNISFIGEDYRKGRQEFYDNVRNDQSRGGKKLKYTKRNKKQRRIRKRTQKKRHK